MPARTESCKVCAVDSNDSARSLSDRRCTPLEYQRGKKSLFRGREKERPPLRETKRAKLESRRSNRSLLTRFPIANYAASTTNNKQRRSFAPLILVNGLPLIGSRIVRYLYYATVLSALALFPAPRFAKRTFHGPTELYLLPIKVWGNFRSPGENVSRIIDRSLDRDYGRESHRKYLPTYSEKQRTYIHISVYFTNNRHI